MVLHGFYEIALRSEYGPDSKMLRKWNGPIAIWIDHRVGEAQKHTELTRMHVDHLATLTGHPIALVGDPKRANVRLIFSSYRLLDR